MKRRKRRLLQYADDTCVIANTPATCQQLLNMVDQWLQWSGIKAKVTKCHTVAIQSSTGHTMDPQLTLAGQKLPFLGNNTITFLELVSSTVNLASQYVFLSTLCQPTFGPTLSGGTTKISQSAWWNCRCAMTLCSMKMRLGQIPGSPLCYSQCRY